MDFWVRFDVRMAPGGESLCLLSWRGDIPPPRWNLETFDLTEDPPKLTRSAPLHGTPCVTPDAGHVVFQGLDGSWHALDTQTGENRHIDVDESMQVADGQPLAVNARPWRMLLKTDDALAVVEPAMAKMHALPGSRAPDPWWRSAFSADASLLAYPVGQLEQTKVLVWDAVRAELLHTFRGYPEEVDRVAFSPDNRQLATVSADRTLRQWDLTTGKLSDWPVAARHEDRILALAYSSDGRLIATGSQDRTVRVWSADTGMLVNVLVGHQAEISSVAFSPDDTHIASVSYDGQVRIWDGTRGSDARVLAGHGLYVYAVALSPDAARLASASWDGTVRVWDADTGDQVTVIPISPTQRAIIRSMVYRPTGAEIAVFEQDLEGPNESRVRVLDASTGISRVVFASDSSGRRPGMVFYPNGSHLAVSGIEEGQVVVFETDQYAPVARVPGGGACAVSFARRTVLAAATEDNRILLYDADSMQPMLELASHPQPIWSLAFSVDGCLLASGGEDDVVRLWDTATGEQLAVLRGHTDNVFAVAFSPDGTRIASGSNDQSIRLWDTESFEEVCHLHGHKEYVFSVTFSPDGRRLFSGSGDYTVRVWEIDPLRVRLLARQEREAMVAELRPVVHQLFDDYEEPSVVVARIESDSSFSDRRREVALQIALAESVKRRDATLRKIPLP